MNFKRIITTLSGGLVMSASLSSAVMAEEINIATVNNFDMIVMQKLSPQWEKKTGHKINWVVLEESVLRQRATVDITTKSGSFDIMTIGAYEAPIWGAKGWLNSLDDLGTDYDYDDIFEGVRNGLSSDGSLYAVPFYAESSFTFYRTDLFEKAGLTMPAKPTYDQIEEYAAKLHDPENEVYGVCLRGKAGWGENMAFVGTLANAYGAIWFDESWETQLDSPEWNAAINYYVNIMQKYGPPGASSNGHNENRALFANGNCAMWVDATSAAGFIYNPDESKVAGVTNFTAAPVAITDKGTGWFWAWALAIPNSSKKVDAAKDFLKWATSKEYVELVGETEGWVSVPPGTRKSTYANPKYIKAAPFAEVVKQSILSADPSNATVKPVPYTGVQFVAIPEFQAIGTTVGRNISGAVAGTFSAEEALKRSQNYTSKEMKRAKYTK